MKNISDSLLTLVFILFCTSILHSQGDINTFPTLKGKYIGQQPPDLYPTLFAPGIISTELHDDGAPLFSPDGSEVYFRIAGKPQSMIFKMKLKDGRWSMPKVDPLHRKYNFQLSAFSHDGSRRFFSSKINFDGMLNDNLDIFYVEKIENGWSSPIKLDSTINTKYDEHLFCLGKDGSIYYGAEYPSGMGKMDIYFSKIIDGKYSEPENIEIINSKFVETAASVAPDESYLIFTSTRYPATSGINLWISFKSNDDKWAEPINMGKKINNNLTDKFSGISPDGKYIFWVSHRENINQNPIRKWDISDVTLPKTKFEGADIYWINAEVVKELNVGYK